MRRGYVASVILLVGLILLIFSWWNTTNTEPPSDAKPLFLGYTSNTIHLDALNITQLSQKARASGYNVTTGHRLGMDEEADGALPTTGCRFRIGYAWDSNYTYFSFSYPENSNATDWLWRILKDSLRLNNTEMQKVEKDAYSNYSVDVYGSNLGASVDGVKPDWVILAKYLGSEVKRDTTRVGQVMITYSSNATILLNRDAVLIESRVEGKDVVLVVNADGYSNICLYVDCASKLDDPIKLFTPVFEALGIPNLELSRLILEESWGYPL
jgi:hypothetical protein